MIRIFTCSVAGEDSSRQSALGFGRYRRDWTGLSRDRGEVPLSRPSGTCLKMSPSLDNVDKRWPISSADFRGSGKTLESGHCLQHRGQPPRGIFTNIFLVTSFHS